MQNSASCLGFQTRLRSMEYGEQAGTGPRQSLSKVERFVSAPSGGVQVCFKPRERRGSQTCQKGTFRPAFVARVAPLCLLTGSGGRSR
ncbi:hypothetical protein PoB_006546400 [Plakobranchus ocellatus]|uniref:Uncharacterized protein n=1 Tax=Plakobranchus ocellatus TaxID=259542 RepID=A0AAV4D476_9GAST|nr:hypothetical protein PoB_006546400 [Plakobranchus ocellatus]